MHTSTAQRRERQEAVPVALVPGLVLAAAIVAAVGRRGVVRRSGGRGAGHGRGGRNFV